MQDQRRFAAADPGHYSPAPITLDERPAGTPPRQPEVRRAAPTPVSAPPRPAEPLFLDEPEDSPQQEPRRTVAISDLFLDEGAPVPWTRSQPEAAPVWEDAEPVLSPSTNAQGETRFAVPLWTRLRTGMIALAQPSLLKAVVVVGAALALAAISVYRTRGVSPLSLWHSLGF